MIADWLRSTRPAFSQLLLIGGSAGWMMSSAWLQGFERIDVVDLDPLSPWLFRLNHGSALQASRTALHFHQVDAMTELDNLLAAYPRASILFDNVLGQHRYRVADQDQAEAELNALAGRLQGRDWGSVHDLFSGRVEASKAPAHPTRLFHAVTNPQGLCSGSLQGDALHRKLLAEVGASAVWMDHLSSGVFPSNTPNSMIYWPFSENYGHWLQAGWVAGH